MCGRVKKKKKSCYRGKEEGNCLLRGWEGGKGRGCAGFLYSFDKEEKKKKVLGPCRRVFFFLLLFIYLPVFYPSIY